MTDTTSTATTTTMDTTILEKEHVMEEKREDTANDDMTNTENIAPNDQTEERDDDVEMEETECKDVSDASVDTTDTVPKQEESDVGGPSPMEEDVNDSNKQEEDTVKPLKEEENQVDDEKEKVDEDESEAIASPMKMDTDETEEQQGQQEEDQPPSQENDDDAYDGPTIDLAALLNVADLSVDQQKLMSSRLGTLQVDYKESVKQQRELRLQEIKNGFKFNVNVEITDEEASFTYDFCKKHQFDPMDKIEDEGVFFLSSMQEMMAERQKQRAAGFDKSEKKMKKKNRKRRQRARNNANAATTGAFSDGSEYDGFSDEDFDDSDDSDYDDDSEPDDLFNNDMDVDGDVDASWADDAEEKKRRRRQRRADSKTKKGEKLNGGQRCGRLLLDDALKEQESKEGWSEARIKAFEQRETNPNSYYYRFNDPGEKQGHGDWSSAEKKLFMERLLEKGANVQWGVFSMKVPGRVGYQCSNYYRQLILNRDITDPNYSYDQGNRKLNFRRGKLKGKSGKVYSTALNDQYKQYAFVVKKDPTGVWKNLPARHPKCPKIALGENDEDEDDGKDVEENVDNEESQKTKKKSVKKSSSGKKKGKKRRKNSDDDGNNENDNEAPARKRRRTDKSTGGRKKKKNTDPNFTATVSTSPAVDVNNPLPDLIDMITSLPVVQPTISPYGHVLGYETWTRILRQGRKNLCPFTKQKLTRRQLTKLTHDNIEQFKENIVNLTAEELGGLSISS